LPGCMPVDGIRALGLCLRTSAMNSLSLTSRP
jgi:hypothetical protein